MEEGEYSIEEKAQREISIYRWLIVAALALAICMYFLGVEVQKQTDIERLSQIFMNERCADDQKIVCTLEVDAVYGMYPVSILQTEMNKLCSKGVARCRSE